MGERLGILGGTFDPVHVGHLVAAVEAREALSLDRVLLVVAGDPWQKHGQVVASAKDRYSMVLAAAEGIEGLEPCDMEIDREGPSYMVDTLEALQESERSLYLLVGSDLVGSLDTWHRSDHLRELVTLAVMERDGVLGTSLPLDGWRVENVPMTRIDISSSELRERLAAGRSVDGLVPIQAMRVLRERRLYTRNK